MNAKTITLRADLVDRLERLAHLQGRTIDDVFGDLLAQYRSSSSEQNWAVALAESMEQTDIEWQDNPTLSEQSREHFKQHAHEKWQRTQQMSDDE